MRTLPRRVSLADTNDVDSEQTVVVIMFPSVSVRDLEGRSMSTPTCLTGSPNVVMVAFRREHQRLVDSWIPWLEDTQRTLPDLRFYEVPAISGTWKPVRRFIDGGMAQAIKVPAVLQRTLTYYGDLSLLTTPLQITDRNDIHILKVSAGEVLARTTGEFSPSKAESLGLTD